MPAETGMEHDGRVAYGVLAAPVMAVTTLVADNGRVMGRLTVPRPMLAVGWAATGLMLAASASFPML